MKLDKKYTIIKNGKSIGIYNTEKEAFKDVSKKHKTFLLQKRETKDKYILDFSNKCSFIF